MVVQSSFSSSLFILMNLMSLMAGAVSQVHGDCVCSPRQFKFKLDFSTFATSISGFGTSVQSWSWAWGNIFSIDEQDGMVDKEVELVNSATSSTAAPSRSIRRRMQDGLFLSYNSTAATSEALSLSGPYDPPPPVVINSIEFSELDTSSNTIHTDLTYTNVQFYHGALFDYTSFSEVDPSVVIGGMQMKLRGSDVNYPMEISFSITYSNTCGVPTFKDGDAMTWVVFVSSFEFWFTSLVVCTSLPNPCIFIIGET